MRIEFKDFYKRHSIEQLLTVWEKNRETIALIPVPKLAKEEQMVCAARERISAVESILRDRGYLA